MAGLKLFTYFLFRHDFFGYRKNTAFNASSYARSKKMTVALFKDYNETAL